MEDDNAFAVYRTFLWLVGVWPLEKRNPFQTLRYVVAAVAQASLVAHTLIELCLNNGQISDMVDVLLFFASAFLALVKHTYMHMYQEKIAENLRFYSNDWKRTKDEKHLRVMRDHLKMYKYQFIIYNSVGYFGTTMFMLRTVLVNILQKRSLQPGEVFEHQFICQTSFLSKSFLSSYYPFLMALQYVQFIYVCTCGASTDCFFFGMVLHLCGQFEILKSKCQNVEIVEMQGATISQRNVQRVAINELISRHINLLKLGQNIEDSFNYTILFQLMTSIILIVMSGCSILVSMMDNDYVTMLVSTNCISFMITESFIYGYASDYLLTQTENIVQAIYMSSWYELENGIKRNLTFLMMRANKPVRITAGKFFYITRNTIVQLLKTSASYLSVIRLTLEMSREVTQE